MRLCDSAQHRAGHIEADFGWRALVLLAVSQSNWEQHLGARFRSTQHSAQGRVGVHERRLSAILDIL